MAEEVNATSEVECEKTNDDELDNLLDSALKDFDKHAQLQESVSSSSSTSKKSRTECPVKNTDNKTSSQNDVGAELPDLTDPMSFNEDSIMKLMSQFEQTFQSLAEDGDESMSGLSEQFSKNFKRIAEDTMRELKEETGSSEGEFANTITETLKNLSENAGSLQGNENDLLNMLGALGIEGEADSVPSDFSAMFNNIMQLFLSKDILYPSLKELVSKYPEWLEENKSSISTDDYTRYSKQLEIMKKICSEMENATDGDDSEVKSERFSKVLELMQQMQEYGNPPKSLMGDSLMEIPNWI